MAHSEGIRCPKGIYRFALKDISKSLRFCISPIEELEESVLTVPIAQEIMAASKPYIAVRAFATWLKRRQYSTTAESLVIEMPMVHRIVRMKYCLKLAANWLGVTSHCDLVPRGMRSPSLVASCIRCQLSLCDHIAVGENLLQSKDFKEKAADAI